MHESSESEAGRTLIKTLEACWQEHQMSVVEVLQRLGSPDVLVTNERDKEEQLAKLEHLDEAVRRMAREVGLAQCAALPIIPCTHPSHHPLQVGLAQYVAQFDMAAAINDNQAKNAKKLDEEVKKLEASASAAARHGEDAKAKELRQRAQQSRVAAAKAKAAASSKAEARISAAIVPISKKLDKVQKHNATLRKTNKTLEDQVRKLESEVKRLEERFA